MLSRRNIGAIAALVPLIAIAIFLREKTPPPVAAADPAPLNQLAPTPTPAQDPAPATTPTNRAAASLGITDIKALERFNAKRDAQAFAHAYDIAIRLGVKQLAAVTSPRDALAMLVQGVRGEGDMIHSFRDLNSLEIEAAASLVAYNDGKMILLPEAEFTALEEELKARALSCKYGACTDCIADVRANRLKQAREATASRP